MQPTKYNQFTKHALFTCLALHDTAHIAVVDVQGSVIRGILLGIAREDGSGRSFLLTMSVDGPVYRKTVVYVRTID